MAWRLVSVVVVMLGILLGHRPVPAALGGAREAALTVEEARFTTLLNDERTARGLVPLTVAPLLVSVAREKSQEMYTLNYWSHTSPVPEKRTAMRRVLYYLPKPPKTMTVGENLAYSDRMQVEEGHQALMASPTHRHNILKPEYRYVGVGCFTAPDGRFWTTELFLDIAW